MERPWRKREREGEIKYVFPRCVFVHVRPRGRKKWGAGAKKKGND